MTLDVRLCFNRGTIFGKTHTVNVPYILGDRIRIISNPPLKSALLTLKYELQIELEFYLWSTWQVVINTEKDEEMF